jgi:hypothetical protein
MQLKNGKSNQLLIFMIELAFCQHLIARFSELSGIAGQTYVQKVVDHWVSIGLFRFRFETLVYLFLMIITAIDPAKLIPNSLFLVRFPWRHKTVMTTTPIQWVHVL